MFSIDMLFEPIFLFKAITLIVIGLYIAFAAVIANQVRTMNHLVSYEPTTAVLQFLAVAHLLAAISLFLLALAIL